MGAIDKQKDALALAMQRAYYTAYWNNAKRPKSLDRVIRDIYKEPRKDAPLDVEKFKKRKRRFEQLGGYQH